MNVICLTVDRLHAGYMGAYGNSWIRTPAIDRLAAESFLFDQALIDTPDQHRLYRSYWQGRHALSPASAEDGPSLAALLGQAGFNTALLTDERLVARHPAAVDFDELIEIDPPWQPETADEIEQTHLANCFVQAIDWLESARGPFLLWCHLAGLGTTWDAPLAFRRTYREEGDPSTPESAEVPEQTLREDDDPDELLGVCQSYAGQVSLFDACFGALAQFVANGPIGQDTLLVLTSPRGFALGEHGRVGPCDEALYGELVHVPLMLKFPDGLGAAARSQALTGPADLWATLLEYCTGEAPSVSPVAGSLLPIVREEIYQLHDRLCVTGGDVDRAVRTPAWYLRPAAEPELYAKPDDRWEVNNVADRCHEVVEKLRAALAVFERALADDHGDELPPLDEILLSGWE